MVKKRRIPVDQFPVTYYSSFVPHDCFTNDKTCNLLKCLYILDVDIDEFDGNLINYHYF